MMTRRVCAVLFVVLSFPFAVACARAAAANPPAVVAASSTAAADTLGAEAPQNARVRIVTEQKDAGRAIVAKLAAVESAPPASSQTEQPAAAPAAAQIDPEANPAGWIAAILAATAGHHWIALVALIVLGLVAAARKWGAGFWPWLGSKTAGVVLALVGGLAGAIAVALAGGAAWSWSILVDGIGAGLLAMGAWDSRKLVVKSSADTYVPPSGNRISRLSAS